MSYSYNTVDTSPSFDQEEDERFNKFLARTHANPGDPICRRWLEQAAVSKGVRDNNLDLIQEYLSTTEDTEEDTDDSLDLTRDVLQAIARGHEEIFGFLLQQNISFVDTSALQTAAYYGRVQCVKTLIECADFSGWQIDKGIEAAIEGRQMHILCVLFPHANMKKHNSCALRGVLEREDYEVAELLFPYINPSKAIKDIKEHATNERVKPMIKWIKQKLSDQKLKDTLENAVANVDQPPKTGVARKM